MNDQRDPLADWLSPDQVTPLAPQPGAFRQITRRARRRRRVRLGSVSLSALVLMIGLAGLMRLLVLPQSDQMAVPPANTTGTLTAASGAGQTPSDQGQLRSGATGSRASGSSGAVNGSGPSQTSPAVGRCAAQGVMVTMGPSDGSAGHMMITLVFTNVSSNSCDMTGFPGVSFVLQSTGPQVNEAAVRSGSIGPTVRLLPGGMAQAKVLLVDIGVYDQIQCAAVQVAGLRVYLPDDTTAVFVAYPQKVCSGKGYGVPAVYSVTSG